MGTGPTPSTDNETRQQQPALETHVATHPCLIVTVVRHAETRLNKKGRGGRYLQGQLDEDLTENGLMQAKAIASRLRKQKFDRIITSDLKQTVQTTNEIEKYQKDAKVTTDIRLREQDLADLAGRKLPEVQKFLKESDNHLDGYLKKKGECNDAFKKRVLEVYHDLVIESLVEPHYDFLDKVVESEAKREAAKAEYWAEKQQQHPQQKKKEGSSFSPATIVEVIAEATATTKEATSELASVSTKMTETTMSLTQTSVNKAPPSPLLKSKSAPGSKAPRHITPLITGNLSTTTLGSNLPSPHSPSTLTLPHPLLTPTSPNRPSILSTRRQRRPQFPAKHILLVTHGGCIRTLFKHLMTDLGFPVRQAHVGFPKPTGVFQFSISKQFWADGDYEWSGLVVHMNNVAHLADLELRHGLEAGRKREENRAGKKGKGCVLPVLPKKMGEYERDRSSEIWPTPQVSPEQSAPPQILPVPAIARKSLGW
ncbi:hypothetical protein BC830DRAFT_593827 [Chytriomyces sp. MP71]|nr:hypothetical protein BC830DRAFT_593827 [Chytriomyces sp. MP71]